MTRKRRDRGDACSSGGREERLLLLVLLLRMRGCVLFPAVGRRQFVSLAAVDIVRAGHATDTSSLSHAHGGRGAVEEWRNWLLLLLLLLHRILVGCMTIGIRRVHYE